MKTLHDLMQDYIQWRMSLKMSECATRCVRYGLLRFFRWLSTRCQAHTADQLRKEHIHLWQKHLAEKRTRKGYPLKASAINKEIENLRAFFKYLISQGFIQRRLLDAVQYVPGRPVRPYDISPDGQRFLFLRKDLPPPTPAPREMHVVVNWFEELKRLVPANHD